MVEAMGHMRSKHRLPILKIVVKCLPNYLLK